MMIVVLTVSKKGKKMKKSPVARLRFTAYAWAKLEYLRDLGSTEVGGFGIANAGDPLLITDICLIKQTCSGASVEFDDVDVADFFDEDRKSVV